MVPYCANGVIPEREAQRSCVAFQGHLNCRSRFDRIACLCPIRTLGKLPRAAEDCVIFIHTGHVAQGAVCKVCPQLARLNDHRFQTEKSDFLRKCLGKSVSCEFAG